MPDQKRIFIHPDHVEKQRLHELAVVDEIGKALEGIIYGKVTITVRDSRVIQLERLTLHRQV